MATTTPVSQLIINKLTKEQYNALEYKDPYQLYMITDGTSTALTLGSWISTTRTDIPYGLLRADGKCYSSELSSGDVPIYYTKDSFPSLWSALENGTIRSVGTYTFEKALETNGWCGVFGFGKEEVTRKFYSWSGLYWLLSETPKTGDRAYDANGGETDRTVTVADDGSVTFVQDATGGTVSGLVRDSANDYSITQTLGRDDVFYIPKVTNHEQQNVLPEVDGSNKNLGRILVAEQVPTVENGQQWYKLYSDGWVEQGGRLNSTATSGTFTLPVQMANSNYSVVAQDSINTDASTDTAGVAECIYLSDYTNVSFRFSNVSGRNSNWLLNGYANTTKIPGFRVLEDNFLIQAYNSNKEVTIADYNDQVRQYVDNSVIPEIDKTAANWLRDITYKMGNLVQSTRSDLPLGLIRADGLNTDGETTYTPESYPDLYEAIIDGKIKSVDIATFNSLIEVNGWCGVFGLQTKVDGSTTKYYAWQLPDGNVTPPDCERTYYTTSEQPSPGDVTYAYISGTMVVTEYNTIQEITTLTNGTQQAHIAYTDGWGYNRNTSSDITIDIESRPACFYAPKITNVHQYGAIPTVDGTNKHLGRTLIKSQEPTAENNYTWYNLYNDGWVEQGGMISTNTDAAFVQKLPVVMGSNNYNVVVTRKTIEDSTGTINSRWCRVYDLTTTTFTTWGKYGNHTDIFWQVCGYAFEAPEQLPTCFIVAYSNTTEVTIGDYNAMLQEYKEETIKPDIYNYSESLKPGLQEYVDKAKEWATSDNIVDVEKDLYSAKKYAERAADIAQCYYQPIKYVNLIKNGTTTVNLNTHPIVVCKQNGKYISYPGEPCYRAPENDIVIDGVQYYAWFGQITEGNRYTLSETPQEGDAIYYSDGTKDVETVLGVGDSGEDLEGGSTYTINLSLDITTTEIDCWTYEVHLQVGDAIPTINWQTSDNKQIRWVAYSPKSPQLTNSNAMFVFRNQGGVLIGNYSGAY